MGLNTTVLVLNDRLGDIEKDQNLGKLLALAINSHSSSEPQTPVGHGVYVIETHHADDLAIVAVGGNTSQVLGHVPADLLNTAPSKEQDAKNIVRQLALRLGLKDPFGEPKPPKLSREEMNEFIKKEYGYRMVVLRSEKKPKIVRRKVS